MDLRINGDYLSVQRYIIVFYNREIERVYCAVRFESLNVIQSRFVFRGAVIMQCISTVI